MSDNPFAEPDDSDRTVIRPAPGGRRAPQPSPPAPRSERDPADPAPPMEAAPVAGGEGAESLAFGQSPLMRAAAPLLLLMARLRNTLQQPESGDLRERAVRAMRQFEMQARAAGIGVDLLRPAHYALCASLDDVVLATPWGSQGAWAQRSLVSTFHQEVRSGERFFDVLGKMRQAPEKSLPVLELFYTCLSLGYMGRYRLSPRGPAEIDRLREELHGVIRQARGAAEPGLSPKWQGVAAPYRPARARVPLWVVAVAALGVLALVYAGLSLSLGNAANALDAAAIAAKPAAMPKLVRSAPVKPPPPPVMNTPTILDQLRGFLAPEIKAGKVSVLGTLNAPIIRINNDGLFASGSDQVEASAAPLLRRIGAALARHHGKVEVIGYTDSLPIHTLRFPNNLALSRDRAKAASSVIDKTLNDPSRIKVEGRGAADPIASNATKAGRAQNRRIEIVLDRTAPTGGKS